MFGTWSYLEHVGTPRKVKREGKWLQSRHTLLAGSVSRLYPELQEQHVNWQFLQYPRMSQAHQQRRASSFIQDTVKRSQQALSHGKQLCIETWSHFAVAGSWQQLQVQRSWGFPAPARCSQARFSGGLCDGRSLAKPAAPGMWIDSRYMVGLASSWRQSTESYGPSTDRGIGHETFQLDAAAPVLSLRACTTLPHSSTRCPRSHRLVSQVAAQDAS